MQLLGPQVHSFSSFLNREQRTSTREVLFWERLKRHIRLRPAYTLNLAAVPCPPVHPESETPAGVPQTCNGASTGSTRSKSESTSALAARPPSSQKDRADGRLFPMGGLLGGTILHTVPRCSVSVSSEKRLSRASQSNGWMQRMAATTMGDGGYAILASTCPYDPGERARTRFNATPRAAAAFFFIFLE
jgi:hypothetical protein